MDGLLFVFSGPSGVGKNTIMNMVMEARPDLVQIPTATTRARREDEREGREHEFLTEAEFRQRILDKTLIEWQIIHDKGVYGVPRHAVQRLLQNGTLGIADVDVLGAISLKEEFSDHVVLIFVQAPDKATLEKRLRERSDVTTDMELRTRLRRADFEMGFADQYDHIVTNGEDELDVCTQVVIDIINRTPRPLGNGKVGRNPNQLRYLATGLVMSNDHQLLQQNGEFPTINVPDDQLPYEALCHYFQQQAAIEIAPTRQHADKRVVDIAFEPPQLVCHTRTVTGIERDHIYILQLLQQTDTQPEGWEWVSVADLQLDDAILKLWAEAIERRGHRVDRYF